MTAMKRRDFLKSATVGAALSGSALAGDILAAADDAPTHSAKALSAAPFIQPGKSYDVAVIGAGVFGAWTAYHLQKTGRKVVILDAYGAANSRASSGGESRVIRIAYGPDEIYSRWSLRSLALWQEFFAQTAQPLFHRTGVLWMARAEDAFVTSSLEVLQRLKVRHEKLDRAELEKRYPQISFGPVRWAIFEPESGALMARRAVQAVVEELVKSGANYVPEAVVALTGKGKLERIETRSGTIISADRFVFACGPWLQKVVPEVLGGRIFPTRQEVFFFGPAAGDRRFAPPALPVWSDGEFYGIPDLENRGFKIASDKHGPAFDPDTGERLPRAESLSAARLYLARRFPALRSAPLVEARVCQYENTSNGDFLIDRHPARDNAWLVGGGSGHGFKHGPALGEYVAARVTGAAEEVEPRFSLATKSRVQKRTVH